MGSDAVRAAFVQMRARARAAGLPGIFIMGAARENRGGLVALAHEGYDAGTGYNYPRAGMPDGAQSAPYAQMVDGYEQIWYAHRRPADHRLCAGDRARLGLAPVARGAGPREDGARSREVPGHAPAGARLHRPLPAGRRQEADPDRGLERVRRGRGDRAASRVGLRLPRRGPRDFASERGALTAISPRPISASPFRGRRDLDGGHLAGVLFLLLPFGEGNNIPDAPSCSWVRCGHGPQPDVPESLVEAARLGRARLRRDGRRQAGCAG